VIGQRIDNFVGRPGIDIGVLMKNLRDYDVVPRFSNDQIWYGLAIREVARRAPVAGNDNRSSLPDTDNFAELVGRVPLKDLVRESTDLIEKRCIETALDITRGNRASAAEMLGLSRQSLYVKLRRYDLGGTDEDGKGAHHSIAEEDLVLSFHSALWLIALVQSHGRLRSGHLYAARFQPQ